MFGLLLDRPSRQIKLAVLSLDLGFLHREKLCLLLKLCVGGLQLLLLRLHQLLGSLERGSLLLEATVLLLQLLLLALQLTGQRLRLLEQRLGPHVRLDRVQNDTDRLGQLIKKREAVLGEPCE